MMPGAAARADDEALPLTERLGPLREERRELGGLLVVDGQLHVAFELRQLLAQGLGKLARILLLLLLRRGVLRLDRDRRPRARRAKEHDRLADVETLEALERLQVLAHHPDDAGVAALEEVRIEVRLLRPLGRDEHAGTADTALRIDGIRHPVSPNPRGPPSPGGRSSFR
jgi:hypothetical protein